MRRGFFCAVAASLALASPAPAQPMPGMAMPEGRDEMAAAMQKMDRDMAAAPMTGDPDRDFVAMMIPHHQGAVDMAQLYLRDGRDPAMRELARSIVADQEREIAVMKAWQEKQAAR
jgi:uncharacterized protein (DUF305 family)